MLRLPLPMAPGVFQVVGISGRVAHVHFVLQGDGFA